MASHCWHSSHLHVVKLHIVRNKLRTCTLWGQRSPTVSRGLRRHDALTAIANRSGQPKRKNANHPTNRLLPTGYFRTHFVANRDPRAIYNPRTEANHDQNFVCCCACGWPVRLHCRSAVRLRACAGLRIWLRAWILCGASRRCRHRYRRILRARLAAIASLRHRLRRRTCRASRIQAGQSFLTVPIHCPKWGVFS